MPGEQTTNTPLTTENQAVPPLPYMPKDVSDVDMAFGGIDGLMPAMKDIPDDLPQWSVRLFNDWFYCGLTKIELTAKPGIDGKKAMRHIRTIMGSFSPKHEHKEGACAYFFQLWFEPGTWERKEMKL